MTRNTFRLAFAALAASMAMHASAFPFDDYFARISVQEYVNDYTGHYFLVAENFEKQALDSGAVGPGWHPTGHAFGAYVASYFKGSPVCRFYAASPNTHFYTASASECDLLRTNGWGWTYEGTHFRVDTPVDGACAAGEAPIYRLYNNRFQFNDSNHRYVAEAELRADMVRQGWTDEGVVFCANDAAYSPVKSFAPTEAAPRPLTECENEDLTIGSCLAMNGLPASLPNRIWRDGPGWAQNFIDLTGNDGNVYTAQSPTYAAITHTFIQRYDVSNSTALGSHVSSLDSLTPLASIEPLYQFSTRPPAQGATDARVFPWRAPRENHLDVSFDLIVQTARRSDPQSHAYGAPMIEFRDVRSGYAIDVTMLTFATFPPGEFVGQMDPVNGNVIVSTSFWAKTMFGTRVSGNFLPLGGGAPYVPNQKTSFKFRITPDDFAKIIAMARSSNPALSQDPKNYLLVNIRFRNGILGNAELGTSLESFGISLFGY